MKEFARLASEKPVMSATFSPSLCTSLGQGNNIQGQQDQQFDTLSKRTGPKTLTRSVSLGKSLPAAKLQYPPLTGGGRARLFLRQFLALTLTWKDGAFQTLEVELLWYVVGSRVVCGFPRNPRYLNFFLRG